MPQRFVQCRRIHQKKVCIDGRHTNCAILAKGEKTFNVLPFNGLFVSFAWGTLKTIAFGGMRGGVDFGSFCLMPMCIIVTKRGECLHANNRLLLIEAFV